MARLKFYRQTTELSNEKPFNILDFCRVENIPACLESVFRYIGNTESFAKPGQMDLMTIAVLYLETMDHKGYRMLKRKGVDRRLALNTARFAHDSWRLSGSQALASPPIDISRTLDYQSWRQDEHNRCYVIRTALGVGGAES